MKGKTGWMKKSVLMFLALFLLSGLGTAASKVGKKEDRRVEDMATELKLTQPQREKIQIIFEEGREKNRQLREEIRQRRLEIQNGLEQKIYDVLTPKQRKMYERKNAERKSLRELRKEKTHK